MASDLIQTVLSGILGLGWLTTGLTLFRVRAEQRQKIMDVLLDKRQALDDIEQFASKARESLSGLNFEQKRAIAMNTVDRVIGTQQRLQVIGYISIPDHVELRTSDRHGLSASPHFLPRRIPFEFMIPMPPPLRRGVDYGFLPGTNVSQCAAESAHAA